MADGETTPRGAPKNPLQLGATFWYFRHESRVTSPPIWAQNLMLPPLWALAKAFGVRTRPRPINAYVIEHRDGLVLFDTGQDRASVTDPGYFPQDRHGISLEALAGETVSLLDYVRNRFGGDTCRRFLVRRDGRSVRRRTAPNLVATLVAVGTDIDGAAAGTSAYDFALSTARRRGHRRATRQLQAIGPPPHLTSKQFTTRVRWATNFGGVTTVETGRTLARGLLYRVCRK